MILAACNHDSKPQAYHEQPAAETPEVLTENSNFDVAKSFPRYNKDIIYKLYQEALEKNDELQLLDKQITTIFEKSGDEVTEFDEYTNVSEDYWQTADNYINNINDTTLRSKTAALFKSFAADYKATLINHKNRIASIAERKVSLQDHLILLKLLVTQPMIKTFQENEIPDLEKLQQVIHDYDGLIDETRAFITEIE